MSWRIIVCSRIQTLCYLLLGLFSTVVIADIEVELGVEGRYFTEEGLHDQAQFHSSVRAEIGYSKRWLDDSVELLGFGRYDLEDKKRSHADLREAAWTHVGSRWELKFGVSKVFWGVTVCARFITKKRRVSVDISSSR